MSKHDKLLTEYRIKKTVEDEIITKQEERTDIILTYDLWSCLMDDLWMTIEEMTNWKIQQRDTLGHFFD
uniref:Uncharacterized protein n=1 Tax=viral metagenome TaxID=1070528 RepID=A0A6M3KW37_9ZZZZ